MYRRNRTGPRTVPCGTPENTGSDSDDAPSRTSWQLSKINLQLLEPDLLIQMPKQPSLNYELLLKYKLIRIPVTMKFDCSNLYSFRTLAVIV